MRIQEVVLSLKDDNAGEHIYMKEFVLNHKIRVLVIIAVVAAICFGAVRFMRPAGPGGETAYVEKVENLTGQNASLGLINRFAGIVEPQGTWSIARNTDVEIKEIFVEEGEEVEEGDPLFEYSILKYEGKSKGSSEAAVKVYKLAK